MSLPASIENNLKDIEYHTLYGKSILSYSQRELAAFIVYQNEEKKKWIDEKNRQLRNIISLRKGG